MKLATLQVQRLALHAHALLAGAKREKVGGGLGHDVPQKLSLLSNHVIAKGAGKLLDALAANSTSNSLGDEGATKAAEALARKELDEEQPPPRRVGTDASVMVSAPRRSTDVSVPTRRFSLLTRQRGAPLHGGVPRGGDQGARGG